MRQIWFLIGCGILLGTCSGCILSSVERAEYRAINERLGTYAPMVVAGVESRLAGKSSTIQMLQIVNTAMQNYAVDYARKQEIEANETPWWQIAGIGLSWGLSIAGVFFGGRYPILNTLKSVVRGVEKAGSKETKTAIQTQALQDGVEAGLHAIVKSVTSKEEAS